MADEVQKRERLRTALQSLVKELNQKLRGLKYTIETLGSLEAIKQHEKSAKIVVDSKKLIEIYPHNKEAVFVEPIFLPTASTRALPPAALEKLRNFQNAVLFTLWKVQVRLSVVERFVNTSQAVSKLVAVGNVLKQIKALFQGYQQPDVAQMTQHEAQVRAVRQVARARSLSSRRGTHGDEAQPTTNAPGKLNRSNSLSINTAANNTGGATTTTTTTAVANKTTRPAALPHSHSTPVGMTSPMRTQSSQSQRSIGSPQARSPSTAVGSRSLLLATIDDAFNDLDQQLARLESPSGALAASAGERGMRAHDTLCRCRKTLVGHRQTYTDAPATERVRVASAARSAARSGIVALLCTLTDFGLHELRLHLKRARERLGSAPDLAKQIEFACQLRDLALCVASASSNNNNNNNNNNNADDAFGGAALARLLANSAQQRASSLGWQFRDIAARLHDEHRDAQFVRRELRHFRELEASVIDANARAQVLGLAVRALKAKLRALTRQQYHNQAVSDGALDDVDVNVLELELLELTVQLDARVAVVRGSAPLASPEPLSNAADAVSAFVGAFLQQGAHHIAETAAHLKTSAERDEIARLVTDSFYPDLLISSAELSLLRVLGPVLRQHCTRSQSIAEVLPIDGTTPSFARRLMERYGRRRALRAYTSLVLRDTLLALCDDPPLLDESEARAQLSSGAAARVQEHCKNVLERLVRTLDQAPIGMRFLARELVDAMRQRYPQESARDHAAECAAARFVFGALLGPTVLYPDLYGVFSMTEMPRTRENLTLLSRVLSHIGSGSTLSGELALLAPFVDQLRGGVVRYVAKLADVGDMRAYFDYPTRPPPSDATDYRRRASPVHVLRASELAPLLRLFDAQRSRLLKPSRDAAADKALCVAARRIEALPASERNLPVAVESQSKEAAAAASSTSNDGSLRVRDATVALVTTACTHSSLELYSRQQLDDDSGGLVALLERVAAQSSLPADVATAARKLVDATRQCKLRDADLLHRLDTAHRMRALALRQLFLDKCELVQALREHREECTALIEEQRAYVQFARQLSGDEWSCDLEVACGHTASDTSRTSQLRSSTSGGPLDYIDSETLFAFDCSVDVPHTDVVCWQLVSKP